VIGANIIVHFGSLGLQQPTILSPRSRGKHCLNVFGYCHCRFIRNKPTIATVAGLTLAPWVLQNRRESSFSFHAAVQGAKECTP